MGDLKETGNMDVLFFGTELDRQIFLYVLPVLVVMTLVLNVLVVYVFSQKGFRNSTTLLLIFIAASDSFAGLSILPTGIAVYKDALPTSNDELYSTDETFNTITISQTLCRSYWISAYISMAFQFISFWLTTYLGIQRYISVKYPLKRKTFFTKRRNIIICVVIVLSALILHSPYLVKDSVNEGGCHYRTETPCTESCVYMLATVLLQHIIPCVLLTTSTVLLVCQLYINRTSVSISGQGNRHVSKIVIAVAVVFLLQEIPLGLSALHQFIIVTFDIPFLVNLKTNLIYTRIFEIAMYVSFTANFFIYYIWNKRFRATLQNVLRNKISVVASLLSSQPTEETDRV